MRTYGETPVYKIDLDADPSERWEEVIQNEAPLLEEMGREAMENIPLLRVGEFLATFFSRLLFGSEYYNEFRSWAKELSFSAAFISLLNLIYEASHVGEYSIYGCTAGVKWMPRIGFVHVRNMDWPIGSIGKATRIFEFQRGGKTKFVSIGLPGISGIMSGMVPGKYSITLNWAPPDGWFPNIFGASPTLLIREVLDTCEDFDSAVEALSEAKLTSPAFFVVCGVYKNEACVVERTVDECEIRWIKHEEGEILTQANHHVAEYFEDNNDELDYPLYEDDEDGETMLEDSEKRDVTLWNSLNDLPTTGNLNKIKKVLDKKPVFNECSFQQMVFHPASGEYGVWRNRS